MALGQFLFALNAGDSALLWRHETSYFIAARPLPRMVQFSLLRMIAGPAREAKG
jgi:hypothetical protein